MSKYGIASSLNLSADKPPAFSGFHQLPNRLANQLSNSINLTNSINPMNY